MKDFEILTRLRNLPQYKDSKITDEELLELYMNRERDIDSKDISVDELFIDNQEKKEAKKLLKKYLKDYSVETIADKNTLSNLIHADITHRRLQKESNELVEKKKPSNPKLLEMIHKNLEQIAKLKKELGLNRDKTETSDSYSHIQLLKRKFKAWLENNQLSRHFTCPYCGKQIWLKLRNEAWEMLKHPYLKDRILVNEEVLALYLQGIIKKKNVAKIFGTSEDQIDWTIEKLNPDLVKDLKVRDLK